jgi:hypothetical protein
MNLYSVDMAKLTGFLAPQTPSGTSAIVPDMPWYYSGTLLTAEYRTDPAHVAALLPDGVELADDDPGAVALVWADWQSCSSSRAELLDPVRSQYLETFAVVRCQKDGVTYSRCVAIWVTKDFALARGWFQGYPKKIGSMAVTRVFTVGKASPRLAPGAQLGASPGLARRHAARTQRDRWIRQRPRDAALALGAVDHSRRRQLARPAHHDGRG